MREGIVITMRHHDNESFFTEHSGDSPEFIPGLSFVH